MLDFLKALFLPKTQMAAVAKVTGNIAQIVGLFESEYMQNHDAKNSAIDAVIKILQDHKDPEKPKL